MTQPIDFALGGRRIVSLLGSAVVTAILFVVLVPLSHWLAPTPEVDSPRIIDTVVLTPPPPPPPPPKESDPLPQSVQMTSAPQRQGAPIELELLDVSMPQPIGQPQGEVSLENFALVVDAVAEIQAYEVADLDRIPQLIVSPPNVKPYELMRDEITGTVRLKVLISPQGHVKVLEVMSTDHPRLVKHARDYVEKCRFESPMRNNQPVPAHYYFPIKY